MKKVFMIDGGAGRVICAIPALLKYNKLNPKSNWNIILNGWQELFWSIPALQDRTFSSEQKGIFDLVFKDADEVITPEPYKIPDYYNQKISLAEAFDRQINNTTDHSDLIDPYLVLNKKDIMDAKQAMVITKDRFGKQKTIVFQPFGRGATPVNISHNEKVTYDQDSRSLDTESFISLSKKLAERYNIIFFGEPELQHPQTANIMQYFTGDLRQWAGIVKLSDYFIGVDSVGQHIARSVNTPGTVIIGSTFPINTSYPNYFNIIEKNVEKKYSPIRISNFESSLNNRLNEATMQFSEKEINDMFINICKDIEKKVK